MFGCPLQSATSTRARRARVGQQGGAGSGQSGQVGSRPLVPATGGADARWRPRSGLRTHLRHGLGPGPGADTRCAGGWYGAAPRSPLRCCRGGARHNHRGDAAAEGRAAGLTRRGRRRCGRAPRSARAGGTAGRSLTDGVEPLRRGAPGHRALAGPGRLRRAAVAAPRRPAVGGRCPVAGGPSRPPRARLAQRQHRRRDGDRYLGEWLAPSGRTAQRAAPRTGARRQPALAGRRGPARRRCQIGRCRCPGVRDERRRTAARPAGGPVPGGNLERRSGSADASGVPRGGHPCRPGGAGRCRRDGLAAYAHRRPERPGGVLGRRAGAGSGELGGAERRRLACCARAGGWAPS